MSGNRCSMPGRKEGSTRGKSVRRFRPYMEEEGGGQVKAAETFRNGGHLMGSGRKGRDLDRSANQRERPMATIVEYSARERAINAYPRRIISPPVPSRCCSSSTVQVGEIQNVHGWPFVYQRCAACGFTVRRFAPQIGRAHV